MFNERRAAVASLQSLLGHPVRQTLGAHLASALEIEDGNVDFFQFLEGLDFGHTIIWKGLYEIMIKFALGIAASAQPLAQCKSHPNNF